jgi:hypothetical protein
VFARLVLGYVLALPFIAPQVAAFLAARYTVAITMQSQASGSVQLYFENGEGFSEGRSAAVPLQASDGAHEYHLPLPRGTYRSFRIDPGTAAGRYVIERVAILDPGGSLHAAIPLDRLSPANQITVVERTTDRLVLEAPSSSNDPQLLYAPPDPVRLPRQPVDRFLVRVITRTGALWLAGIVVAWLLDLTLGRGTLAETTVARVAAAGYRSPRAAVFIAALLGTVVSAYPVLFLGRSFVSPNVGTIFLLYAEAPYTPGSTDRSYEDPRGSDVSAAIVQDVPHSNVERQALATGEIPLWNRYNAAGRPFWGQGVVFLLDPLHWLTVMTPDPALGWDLKFVAHRLVFALGVGTVALVATGGWLPSALVAAAAPFAGIYAYRLNHPALFALSYAPWVLLGWFLLIAATDRRQRAAACLLLALSSALVLVAGPPKEAIVVLIGIQITGLVAVLLTRSSWLERARCLAAAGLAGAAVVLITAPHWLLFLTTLQRSFTAYDVPYALFAGRSNAVGFFLGPLMPGPFQPGLHLLGLVLVAAAIAAPRQLLARPAALACAIGGAGLTAIAFGAVPGSVLTSIPLVGRIGHVHDVFLTAPLPLLLVVAAVGAEVLLTTSARVVVVITAAVSVACWWLFANVGALSSDLISQSWAVVLALPIAAVFPFCLYGARTSVARAAALAALCVLLLPGGLHTDFGVPALDALLLQPRSRAAMDQNSPAVDAIHRASNEPARTVGLDWALFSGSQALYELEGIGGADPLELPTYRELVDAAGIWRQWVWFTMVTVVDSPRLAPLLDMLNVGYFLARTDYVPAGFVDVPVPAADRLRVGRRETAWPRAFFVDGVTSYTTPGELLGKVAEHQGPLAAVQVTDRQAMDATASLSAPSTAAVAAHGYELTTNSTTFTVQASGPGLAVLSESYVPENFRATLNHQPVAYFRVNHAFKGVVIPGAGQWVVKFEYRPIYSNVSLMMAAVGLILLAVFGVFARRSSYLVGASASENPAARASS